MKLRIKESLGRLPAALTPALRAEKMQVVFERPMPGTAGASTRARHERRSCALSVQPGLTRKIGYLWDSVEARVARCDDRAVGADEPQQSNQPVHTVKIMPAAFRLLGHECQFPADNRELPFKCLRVVRGDSGSRSPGQAVKKMVRRESHNGTTL